MNERICHEQSNLTVLFVVNAPSILGQYRSIQQVKV